MKTLKNFNHWIYELRILAIKTQVFSEGDDNPMSKKRINELFNKENFRQQFEEGESPEQAFNNEIESWYSSE